MTRDAKLYILLHKEWLPLAESINSHSDASLKMEITIFQLGLVNNLHYAILSLSPKADKLIEDYGALAASEFDYKRNLLPDYSGEPLYGHKSNLAFLNKFK